MEAEELPADGGGDGGGMTAATALQHFLYGNGTAVSIPFSDVETSWLRPIDFSAVRDLVSECHEEGFTFNRAIDLAFSPDPLGYAKRSGLSSFLLFCLVRTHDRIHSRRTEKSLMRGTVPSGGNPPAEENDGT